MELKAGEIQPVGQEAWTIPEPARRESQVVPPVPKAEGSVGRAVDGRQDGSRSQDPQTDPEHLAKMVAKVQEFIQEALNVNLDFRLDRETNEMVVRVVNRETGKVIRQIPAEEVVALRQKLDELRGVLFNGKA